MVMQAVAAPHPQLPGLPVIDYTLVLAMTPSLMLGLALGVLLNAVISQWLLNLLVIAVWSWSTLQLCWTYRKARVKERQHLQRKQEQQQQQQQQQDAVGSQKCTGLDVEVACTAEQEVKDAAVSVADAPQQQPLGEAAVAKEAPGARLRKAASSWAAYQPWWRVLIIASMFGVFITAQVVRGTVTPACSMPYWLLLGVLSAASAVAAVVVSAWLLRQATRASLSPASVTSVDAKPSTDSLPQTDLAGAAGRQHSFGAYGQVGILGSVVEYSAARLAKINVLMVIAGLLLGTWPLSPIIMALPGMHPQVAAGTSKLMLFMITGGTGLSFIASGNINMSYMLVYGLTNAVATPIGVWVMDRVIKRSGKPSALLLLTIARLAACVVVQAAFQAVPSLIALERGLPKAGFLPHGLCPK
ncbi:hypothetical protein COO60DRAFT_517028 [Scenedesmus sp. NREL 46B-D3]|nr:hypothetical protein COO60DRAFT_517028 [Scenedesmus sp. NREL 46B-D3]